MKRRIEAVLALQFFSCIAMAGGFSSIEHAREVTDGAMKKFAAEEISDGYAVLKPYWPLPPVEIDNLASQTSTQWPLVKQRFGESLGIEFMKEQQVGESFVRFTYIQKFDNHAIRWLFTIYKPKEEWVINGVTFDDQIDELF